MKHLRHGALLALVLGSALVLRAADLAGPGPSDVIHPRGSETAAATAPGPEAGDAAGRSFAPPAPSLGGMATVGGYLAVLVLLVGGAWLLVKRGSLPRPFARSENKLQVLETRMLGNRQCLLVVEYEGARLLLGVCPGRIDYLTPLAPAMAGLADSDRDDDEQNLPSAVAAAFSSRR